MRPRKWSSDAERMAAKRRVNEQPDGVNEQVNEQDVRIEVVNEQTVRIETVQTFVLLPFKHQPHVPMSLFEGVGRGSPRKHTDGKEYVLVARHEGPHLGEMGVVTEEDWRARLSLMCGHGHRGWACHLC